MRDYLPISISLIFLGVTIYFHYNPYKEDDYIVIPESEDNAQQRY